MSVTQVQTSGITDDAVTNAKIANNAVGTTQIANDAITADKLNNTIQTGTAPVFGVRAWGFLNANGDIIRGSGNFTSDRTGNGIYRIILDAGMGIPTWGVDEYISATIVVTVLDDNEEDHIANVKRVGDRSFDIYTRDSETQERQNTKSSFMVIW